MHRITSIVISLTFLLSTACRVRGQSELKQEPAISHTDGIDGLKFIEGSADDGSQVLKYVFYESPKKDKAVGHLTWLVNDKIASEGELYIDRSPDIEVKRSYVTYLYALDETGDRLSIAIYPVNHFGGPDDGHAVAIFFPNGISKLENVKTNTVNQENIGLLKNELEAQSKEVLKDTEYSVEFVEQKAEKNEDDSRQNKAEAGAPLQFSYDVIFGKKGGEQSKIGSFELINEKKTFLKYSELLEKIEKILSPHVGK